MLYWSNEEQSVREQNSIWNELAIEAGCWHWFTALLTHGLETVALGMLLTSITKSLCRGWDLNNEVDREGCDS